MHGSLHHDCAPAVTGEALEEQQRGVGEVVKVALGGNRRLVGDVCEHVDAQDGVHKHGEHEQRGDIHQGREAE